MPSTSCQRHMKKAGLEIKNETKLIHNVSVDLSSDEIKSQLMRQNVEEAKEDIEVVYRYPPHPGKSFPLWFREVSRDVKNSCP